MFYQYATNTVRRLVQIRYRGGLYVTRRVQSVILTPIPSVLRRTFRGVRTKFFAFSCSRQSTICRRGGVQANGSPIQAFCLRLINRLGHVILQIFGISVTSVGQLPNAVQRFFLRTLTKTSRLMSFLVYNVGPYYTILVRHLRHSNGNSPEGMPYLATGLVNLSTRGHLRFFHGRRYFPKTTLPFHLTTKRGNVTRSFGCFRHPVL